MKNNRLSKNRLICGDNLNALNDLKKQGIQVDLIYLDPPFFSNRQYEVVWGDEAEVRSFKDRWAGGINVYIEWMRERVEKMYDVLKDTGSLYLHCDWHANAHLRIMLDELFDHRNFRNEIVWCYKSGGASKYHFAKKHDTIFRYTKSDNFTFNYEKEKSYGKTGGGQGGKVKYYRDEFGTYSFAGIKDWWVISMLATTDSERLGYPTQKPETLLERIIKASSNEGDIVLDPFCGCGTAMAVAQRSGRKWIGIDISPTAINLIEKRLNKLGAKKSKDFDSTGMPTTITELKALEPFEFQNWVINEMQAKQSKRLVANGGLDGYVEKSLYFKSAGIQVKQSEKVGRNVVDNFETALQRKDYNKGYIVGFSFTKGAHEEVARVKEKNGLYIKLIKVEDILKRKSGILK